LNPGIASLVALLLDRTFGEPARLHPLVGFGALAQQVESLARAGASGASDGLRSRGALAVVALLSQWPGLRAIGHLDIAKIVKERSL